MAKHTFASYAVTIHGAERRTTFLSATLTAGDAIYSKSSMGSSFIFRSGHSNFPRRNDLLKLARSNRRIAPYKSSSHMAHMAPNHGSATGPPDKYCFKRKKAM